MSNYTKTTNFTAKDSLVTGDPGKTVLGAEIDTEFSNIATAVATKADNASPTFTGNVTVPTPAIGSDTTHAASTAFVRDILPPGVLVPYGGSSAPSGWLLCDGSAVSRTTYAALFAILSTTYGAGDGSTTFNLPDLRGRAPVGAGTGATTEAVDAGAVTAANDTFDVVSNTDKWVTGVAVQLTTTGTLPAGLSLATTYYIIRASATTIKFATTLANAVAGTQIDITSQGSGVHTVSGSLTARTAGHQFGEETHASTLGETAAHSHTDSGHTHQIQAPDADQAGTLRTLQSKGTSSPGDNYSLVADNSGTFYDVYAKDNNWTDDGVKWAAASAAASIGVAGSGGVHNNMQPSLALNYIVKT